MPKNNLRLNLEHLHRELAKPQAMDAETRELLAELAADIERVLAEEGPENAGLAERVETATVKFEASHPSLARALSEVSDALAKLGI